MRAYAKEGTKEREGEGMVQQRPTVTKEGREVEAKRLHVLQLVPVSTGQRVLWVLHGGRGALRAFPVYGKVFVFCVHACVRACACAHA